MLPSRVTRLTTWSTLRKRRISPRYARFASGCWAKSTRVASRSLTLDAHSSVGDVPIDPGTHAFHQVLHEARPREHMMLTRIHHKLRRDALTAKRLVHLLPASDRYVEVLISAQEKRRCMNPI